MKIIGITGGVGAGKSAILDYIEENYNARVLKADEIAHLLMEPGTDCYRELKKILPDQVFLPDGRLNRPMLAKELFTKDFLRSKVNGIVHPAVKVYIKNVAEDEEKRGKLEYLIIEAALLIEEHYEHICQELWYIYTSGENRRLRLKQNRGYSDEKIDQIFASQLTEEQFRNACQREIDNNGSVEKACMAVAAHLEEISNRSRT